MNDPMQGVRDELAVREMLTRYCRAIDRCDSDLLKSVYWPDATDDHIVFVGNAIEFSDFVMPLLREHTERTMHTISNVWMQVEGDVACSETYVHAYHRLRGGGGDVIVGGRYLDRIERRNGEWRIAERKFVLDWEQNGAPLLGGVENTNKLLGIDTRQRKEDSYRLFANRTLK